MTECHLKDRLYKRNRTLEQLKRMLCKLENKHYEKDPQVPPTVFTRAERCICAEDKPIKGKRVDVMNLNGEEAFPYIIPHKDNIKWKPVYQCMNQAMTKDMGCFDAAHACKECEMCCECEVAVGSHIHMPEKRDPKVPLKGQCYTQDKCTSNIKSEPSCDPNLYPNRWFPNVNSICHYPRACPADCFDNPDLHDWAVSKPSYTYYLQSKCYKPF